MTNDVRVPRLLRVKEVVKLTGIEAWRLYEMIARGEGPPHMRVGKTIRVPEDCAGEVDRAADQQEGDRMNRDEQMANSSERKLPSLHKEIHSADRQRRPSPRASQARGPLLS